jgi:hypothetical protein
MAGWRSPCRERKAEIFSLRRGRDKGFQAPHLQNHRRHLQYRTEQICSPIPTTAQKCCKLPSADVVSGGELSGCQDHANWKEADNRVAPPPINKSVADVEDQKIIQAKEVKTIVK